MKKNKKGGLTFKQFGWILFGVLVFLGFVYYLVTGFFSNCVFISPLRWHFISCFQDQIAPSQGKAFEKASPFMPKLKI